VRTLCLRMMEEMAAAGARIGLPFAMSAADRMAITRKLGDFRTSMLQDLENGAPLEYQPQLGAVVEVARYSGVPAPFCTAVLGLIRQLSNSLAAR
jgi:2-dehydropantoate 2-reductase